MTNKPPAAMEASVRLETFEIMASLKRKLRRKSSIKMAKYLKKNMKSFIQEKIKTSLSGIGKVPDNCTLCEKKFDKSDRDQVFSWMLQVDDKRDVYNLFCPPCYEKYSPDTKEKEVTDE